MRNIGRYHPVNSNSNSSYSQHMGTLNELLHQTLRTALRNKAEVMVLYLDVPSRKSDSFRCIQ
jgi:hypothetical protein